MRNHFIYDGVSSRDLGIIVSGQGLFKAPARNVESISINGRNGDLHIDYGNFKNVEVTYKCGIGKNFVKKYDAFKAFMLDKSSGYRRLEDTYRPEYFRMASLSSDIDPDTYVSNKMGEFDLTFDCKPQLYLKSGENTETIASGAVLMNPTRFDALPLIRVTGSGTLTVGNTIVKCTRTMIIDSESQDCYGDNGENLNSSAVIEEFPVLKPGTNGVTFTGFSKVEITPRWWTI